MKRFAFLAMAAAIVLVIAGALYARDSRVPNAFPPAGIDLVHHELTIAMHNVNDDGSTGALIETLGFKGRMLLERGTPYVNGDGYRQIDFVVKEWQAFAYSKALGTLVTYQLTEGVPQRPSTIVAQTKTHDFPCQFNFRVKFDAIAYGEGFAELDEGLPTGGEFYEVPPSGNRRTSPTITGFEEARIEMDHPALGRIRFVPIMCNDSDGDTLHTFGPSDKVNA